MLRMNTSISPQSDTADTASPLKTRMRALIFCVLVAAFLCFLLEIFSRHSIADAFLYYMAAPAAFIYGCVIIISTQSLCLLFKRRGFALIFINFIWLTLGVVNWILGFYRTTPLTTIDFQLIPSVWSISLKYLTFFQFLLVFLAASVAILLLLYLYKISQSYKRQPYIALTAIAAAYLTLTLGYMVYVDRLPQENQNSTVRSVADNYGYTYCFVVSVFDRGIDKPHNYSVETIESILSDIDLSESTETAERPNIIFIQLESFFDPNTLTNIAFSENPAPVFSELRRTCPSGSLIVPSLATGTVNTEFEILTGMNLDYFGLGEYPYQTVLQHETCESMAYNMKALGYKAHAIHNHSGDFYGRNTVFSNLGFDTFTSIEYMVGAERNAIGWAKDSMLTPEILKTLASTPGEDFIYAISVQAHGQYPRETNNEIEQDEQFVHSFEETDDAAAFAYYLSQIAEVDSFIGELIDALERSNRPVVLVLYGDHLPGLNIMESDLQTGSLYETQYVIWSNIGISAPNRSLYAYQLSPYVQSLLGMKEGLFTRLHQDYDKNPNYQSALELLQYDYLYGEREAFDGIDPYIASELKMGISDIEIKSVRSSSGGISVSGRGFTAYSRIVVNGHAQTTELINGTLFCESETLKTGDVVAIAQVSESGAELSRTGEYLYREIQNASPLR